MRLQKVQYIAYFAIFGLFCNLYFTLCKVYITLCIICFTKCKIENTKGETMTYQEKKSIVSLISAILIFGFYCLYMYPQYPDGGLESTETFRYWGSFVLNLTLVSIVAHIIISIIFNILFRITTREKEPKFADELDKLIDLKAFRNSFFVFIVGFLLAMGSLVIYQPLQVMFIILITSGFISDVTGSATKLYHYRRGV